MTPFSNKQLLKLKSSKNTIFQIINTRIKILLPDFSMPKSNYPFLSGPTRSHFFHALFSIIKAKFPQLSSVALNAVSQIGIHLNLCFLRPWVFDYFVYVVDSLLLSF